MIKNLMKKCCASCQHREIEENGCRLCTKMQIYVKQNDVCSNWRKSSGFKKGPMGKVKRREYLMFVKVVRMVEMEAVEDGKLLPEDMASVDSLRKLFEEETGLSPFVIQ